MNCKENRKELVFKCIYTIALFFCVGCLVIGMVKVFQIGQDYKRSQSKIEELQEKVESLQMNADSNTTASEYEEIISYLETETTKHREFIEDQRQFLIWLVAAIGGVGIVVLGFAGLSNKKDIEDAVNRTADSFSKEAFGNKLSEILDKANEKYLGDKIEYLRDAVEKQEQISKANIIFLTRKNSDNSEMLEACENIMREKCNVFKCAADKITLKTDVNDFKKILHNGKNIIVYEVCKEESVDNPKDAIPMLGERRSKMGGLLYEKVVKCSIDTETYCIIFVKNSVDKKLIDSSVYTGIANTGMSLLQYLHTLINL